MKKIFLPLCILTLSACFAATSVQAKKGIKRPPITGIAHAAFFTKDVESTRKFYKEYLGLAEAFSLMTPDGKELALAFIKINDRQFVEIMEAKTVDGKKVPSSDAPPLKYLPASN